MADIQEILDALRQRFDVVGCSEFRGDHRVIVTRSELLGVMAFLKEERAFSFLSDVSCVDYLNYRNATDRFGLVYSLYSIEHNLRLFVRVMLNEPDLNVPSVASLWAGANWFEREVWDMFGITFQGHPDHRRILMPEEFAAHPLRKDYPLQGRGERHNFPVISRGDA